MMRSSQKIPAATIIFLLLSFFIPDAPFPVYAGCWPAVVGGGGLSMVCGGLSPEGLKASVAEDPKPLHPFSGKEEVWAGRKDISRKKGKEILRNEETRTVSTSSIRIEGGASLTLAGEDEANAPTSVQSNAVGLDGGKSYAKIINTGTVAASATSEVTRINAELNLTEASHGNSSAYIGATATGISGGRRRNEIGNTGTISAEANSQSTSVNIEINTVDAATGDSKLTVEAGALGIDSGRGKDLIDNTGAVRAAAVAQVNEVSVTATFLDLTITDRQKSEVSTTAGAKSVGISAGQDKDGGEVRQAGSVEATATARVHSTGVSLASEGVPGTVETLIEEGGLASLGNTSTSQALGLSGGTGQERLMNSGAITATATSTATQESINVGVAIFDFKVPTPGIVLGGAGTAGEAKAAGIDAGPGNDEILNQGLVKAKADATASATAVSVNIAELSVDIFGGSAGVPFGASLVAADSLTKATAAAEGIGGGAGNDSIQNTGAVQAEATATAGSTSVSATLNVKYKEGDNFFSANAVLARAGAEAESSAVGIDGGGGRDTIVNSGNLAVGAQADTHAVSVGVDVAGTLRGGGGALGLAATDASTTASAAASGIRGGKGDDQIANEGLIQGLAKAEATAVSVPVHVGIAKQGAVLGAALADAGATARASLSGIDGGRGDDRIANEGEINLSVDSGLGSTADAKAVSVAVSVGGVFQGLAGSAALSRSRAAAEAETLGISGGEGEDEIFNSGKVSAGAKADVDSTGVAVGISLAKEGVAGGAALSDSSSRAVSLARAIDGGPGDDRIWSRGVLDAESRAISDSTSVSAQISGALKGVAAGVSMSDSSARAVADSSGISGGTGNDEMFNSGKITARSLAGGDATSVSVTLSAAVGLAAGASLSDSSTRAEARSQGMDGGSGDDLLVNRGEITARSTASADSTSVSVNVALGLAGGASLSDSSAIASADAKGIAGGEGDDRIYSTGPVTAHAGADAYASSVSVNFVGGFLSPGVSFGDASVQSKSRAAGIEGGERNDFIWNEGILTVNARSKLEAKAHSINIGGGWSKAEANMASETTARGIAGGDGDDRIVNRGRIRVGPEPGSDGWMSKATAYSFSFNLAGIAEAKSSLTARTESRGIDGGGGDDRIQNEGKIEVQATSLSSVSSNTVLVFGKSEAGAASGAMTEAVGIDGGEGDDCIGNFSSVTVGSAANLHLDSSSFSFGGSGDAAGMLAGIARSTGISGGAGADFIQNKGTLSVNAASALSATGQSTVIFGSALVSPRTRGETVATGIEGGEGDDRIKNVANLDIKSIATAASTSSSFTFAGGSATEAVITAKAQAVGIDGGGGSDWIYNGGEIRSEATSILTARGGAKTVIGNAEAAATVWAESMAAGIRGGVGDDVILNTKSSKLIVIGNASPQVDNSAAAAVFFSDGRTRSVVKSSVTGYGIDAGDGRDQVFNEGDIRVTLAGNAEAKGISDSNILSNIFGIDVDAYATSTASLEKAQAIGIWTGDQISKIENQGTILVTAAPQVLASATADGDAIISGDGAADATARGDHAEAIGIRAGDGPNTIINRGTLTVRAAPEVTANAVTDADGVGEFRQPDSTATATASADHTRAVGIWVGDGHNRIFNEGILTVIAAPQAYANARGDYGGDVLGIDAFAYTAASADHIQAIGIWAGEGNNSLTNSGVIDVEARPSASASSVALGVGFDGDATAHATARADHSFAAGILAGNGENTISNEGVIHVLASAKADAFATASPGSSLLNDGEKEEFTNASVSNAQAVGIQAGNGKNRVTNWGGITFSAIANSDRAASADARAMGIKTGSGDDVIWMKTGSELVGKAEGYTKAPSGYAQARAVGIDAGDGDNFVGNYGNISVSAGAAAGSWPGGDGLAQAQAVGIRTGSGNDAIVNGGRIFTSNSWTTLSGAGILTNIAAGTAIISGEGDD